PAASSTLGVALSTTGVAAAAANASGSPWISIGIVLQAGSEIGPASPPAVSALAPVKPTAPKLVSGSTLQPEWSHEEGASAIHSAELLSGPGNETRLAKLRPVVRSRIWMRTLARLAVTDAAIESLGRTRMLTATGRSGTSSYQAK